jgi:bile acid:Na+ symporter, BASS family
MKEALEVLDHVRLNFSPCRFVCTERITIAFIMFGVALDIKLQHFKDLLMNPKSVIIGVISQFFLLPVVTFLFIILLNPTPTVALGMILISACPGGNISNFMTAMAKGNVALISKFNGNCYIGSHIYDATEFCPMGKTFCKSL